MRAFAVALVRMLRDHRAAVAVQAVAAVVTVAAGVAAVVAVTHAGRDLVDAGTVSLDSRLDRRTEEEH